MLKYYVKGGPHSHGQHGYIVSNANWDPYPMANKLENFVIALANMDVAVMLRIDRFSNSFFTVVKATDVLPDISRYEGGYTPVELQQEIQSLTSPVAPFGSAIVGTVEDLQAQTLIKVQRARQAVDTTMDLLAFDLLEGSRWMDVRKAQNPQRNFGEAPTAAWTALRKVVPLHVGPNKVVTQSDNLLAASFVHATDPATLYSGALPLENEPTPPLPGCQHAR
jgi:histidine ammonia-lyase